MAEKLVQHKHCRICSKAVPIDEDVCSEECQGKLEQFQKANKKKNKYKNREYDILRCTFYAKFEGEAERRKAIFWISEERKIMIGDIKWPHIVLETEYLPIY